MAACGSHPAGRPRTRVLRQHYFTSGRHYWEVLIQRATSPHSLVVGVTADRTSNGDDWTTDALGYSSAGAILGDGVHARPAQPFGEGDTVGVMLDMNAKRAAFFLNEEPQRDRRADPTAERGLAQVETTSPHDREAELGSMELEMKAPVHATTATRQVTWHAFHCRAMFAAVTVSSEKDEVVVYKTELPESYR